MQIKNNKKSYIVVLELVFLIAFFMILLQTNMFINKVQKEKMLVKEVAEQVSLLIQKDCIGFNEEETRNYIEMHKNEYIDKVKNTIANVNLKSENVKKVEFEVFTDDIVMVKLKITYSYNQNIKLVGNDIINIPITIAEESIKHIENPMLYRN